LVCVPIIQNLPKSHTIYESFLDDLKQINQEIQNRLFIEFKESSAPLSRYMIISSCALLLDILTLFYNISQMDGENSSFTFFTFVASAFISFDLYIPFWYYSLKYSFPEDIWSNLTKIVGGTIEEAKNYVKDSLDRMKPRAIQ